MEIKKKLGQRIRFLRKARGLTQEELAEKAGLSVTFVGLTERGVNIPSVATCARIAEVLGVSLSELFRFEEKTDEREVILKQVYLTLKHADKDTLTLIREITEKMVGRG